MRSFRGDAGLQQEAASPAACRATAPYFSLTTSLIVPVGTSAARASGRRSVVTTVGAGVQQDTAAGWASQQALSTSAVVAQHAVSAAGVAEHTPVAGRISSTRRAASRSPVS